VQTPALFFWGLGGPIAALLRNSQTLAYEDALRSWKFLAPCTRTTQTPKGGELLDAV